jgi:signal transduction histidine kinase
MDRSDCRKRTSYSQMSLDNARLANHTTRLLGRVLGSISLRPVLLTLALLGGFRASAQSSPKKDVLLLNEVGLSHSLTDVMTREIVSGVQSSNGPAVEFYSESLDSISLFGTPSLPETRDWLAKKYAGTKLDVVVAIGPDAIRFVADYADNIFPGVPIVICGGAADQAGNPNLGSRFTGTWQKREPGRTLEAALRLFPNTRRVYVVGGSSVYDRVVTAATKEFISSFRDGVEFSFLEEMEMAKLLEQLKTLPENSIVFYTSYFQDSVGHRFLNATQALPMIASAANAPVFGMSDTYLGHGIVGGDLMNFQEQGKVTAAIVSRLLEGERAENISIETLSSTYMFDGNELQRWHVPESRLPSGSVVLFRKPGVWDMAKRFWVVTLLFILGFSAFLGYLHNNYTRLTLAKEKEKHLSGKLMHAEEKERRRIASELHDDFSQRLAVLSLGLENVDEATPASFTDVHKQLHDLVKSTSDLSTDLHTLSHQLHSSTLESLGLVPAVAALCKEFTATQGIRVDFTPVEVPRTIDSDTALSVFRIVQEGLRNLKKYSGTGEATVNLRVTGDRLEVTVRDEGSGFDLKGLRTNEGLGIRSMEERVRSLGGKFELRSEPGKGTTLRAWLPLKSGGESQGAAASA